MSMAMATQVEESKQRGSRQNRKREKKRNNNEESKQKWECDDSDVYLNEKNGIGVSPQDAVSFESRVAHL